MEENYSSSSSSSSSLFNARPYTSRGAHSWLVAEQSAQGILSTIQPTMPSEHMRNEVIDYLQSLIREYFRLEVFPFGSVPLKTYLPDGDIDVTVVCPQNTDEDLARELCNILECEEQRDTEFVIKNVECVPAQVRVVKCTVQDIPVDISFNQIAGLSALCFLDQVDQLTGKDHLFKRSIILIKAWCYYESRILGALHGLISTYALDVLVLHIVNLFHSSLNGPVSVLNRFLNYYSTFDWDKHCVSLNGPVAISSLPEILVGKPQNDGSNLLLSLEFLKNETGIFSVSTWTPETSEQAFPIKHLNIVDPLKDNNNLGRSVCKVNFHRIKYAFSYGARKLGETFMLPPESVGEGLRKFFVNTLNRNGMGRRPDVRNPVPVFAAGKPELCDLSGDYNSYRANLVYGQHYHNHKLSIQSSPPAALQLNQNIVPLRIMTCLVPRPFCHPIAAQQSSAALGDTEIMKFQGSGTYIPTVSVEGKLNSQGMGTYIPNMESRGTGTFIPDIGVQQKLMSQETGRCIIGIDVEEYLKSRGMGIFAPDKSVEETYKSQGAVINIPDVGIEENYQPGGTDMYIPDVEQIAKLQVTGTYNHDMGVEENIVSQGARTHLSELRKSPYKQMYIWGRGRDAGQITQGLMLKPSLKNGLVRVSSDMEGESSSCLDLSLEEFPLLPGIKKAIPSKTPQPGQPTVEFPHSSPDSESIEFGSFGPSLSPSVPSSTSKDSEPPELSEHKEEIVLVQPYKLEDDNDFPPLS